METIKISVEASVNLSENTQNFIKSLFTGATAATTQVQKPAPAVSSNSASTQSPKPKVPATAPASAKPAAQAAPAAPAAPATQAASKSIEDVRKMLAQKVNEHRDVIKQKLNELGAPSVTKLDPAKYDEMYNFLNAL